MNQKREAGKGVGHFNANFETGAATVSNPAQPVESTGTEREQLGAALANLIAERQALVQSTIDQLNAGGAVDKSASRRIRVIDTQKNQLIVARFVSLLRQNGPEIRAIAEKLLEI